MVRAVYVVLGMVAAALAQESSYTGPMFDPGNAPFFGVSSLVIPTLSNVVPSTTEAPTFIRSRSSTGSVTRSAQSTGSVSSSSVSRSSSASASSSLVTSASQTSSETSSASAPAESTGAAVVNAPVAVGAIFGGLFAGLAML